MIDNAPNPNYRGAMEFSPREPRYMTWRNGDASAGGVSFAPGIPALALPMTNKSELLWPPEQQDHFSGLDNRITRVIIIGWRAAEQLFVDQLRMRVAPGCKWLIAVGRGPDGKPNPGEVDEIADRLRLAAVEIRNATRMTEGFGGLDVSAYDAFLGP